MRFVIGTLALTAVISSCSQEASHQVGKSIRIDTPGATVASVTTLLNGNTFRTEFITTVPQEAKAGALNMGNLSFKVWKANEGGVNVEFALPGTPDTDIDRIGEYLLTLIQSHLKKD